MISGSKIEQRVIMAVCAALATGWLILGQLSDRVPWGSNTFWTVLCGFAAGSAIAVARYQTMFALRIYVIATTIIGVIRSFAYLSENAGGPSAVWFLITTTTIGLYLAFVDNLHRRKHGG